MARLVLCIAFIAMQVLPVRVFAQDLPQVCNKAYSAYVSKDFMAAITLFDECLKIDVIPQKARASGMLARGASYGFLGKHDLAIEEFTNIIRINKSDADAFALRARSYYEIGSYDQSIKDCSQAVLIDSRHLMAYACLALSYKKKGMFEDAVSAAKTARTIDQRIDSLLSKEGL